MEDEIIDETKFKPHGNSTAGDDDLEIVDIIV